MTSLTFRVDTPWRQIVIKLNTRAFTLIPLKQLGSEPPIPVLGDEQFEGTDAGVEATRFVAVALSPPVGGALEGFSAAVAGEVGIEDALQEVLDDAL
ncbi:MAG: hypothetical protein OXM87_09515 [Truepera sp.]|nr:hypothetical protein [Truepera sp.]